MSNGLALCEAEVPNWLSWEAVGFIGAGTSFLEMLAITLLGVLLTKESLPELVQAFWVQMARDAHNGLACTGQILKVSLVHVFSE